MTAIRSRASATKPAARSAVRAPRNAPAARLATIKATGRNVDETIQIDLTDEVGGVRVARILTRASAKRSATTVKASAEPSRATTARTKRSAADNGAATETVFTEGAPKKRATKTGATKTGTAKKSVANKPAAKPGAKTSASLPEPDEPVQRPTRRSRGPNGVTRTGVDRCNDPPPETGLPLIDRVRNAVEREITQIEVIVGGHHLKPKQRTEAERRARTLADVRRMRSDEAHKGPRDDDAIPRDLDELRRALSRRLEQMVAGAARLPAAGDE